MRRILISVAKRRLANVSLGQEVTQIVFIRLAKAPPNICGDAELVAWLHRTTVHASIDPLALRIASPVAGGKSRRYATWPHGKHCLE